MDPLYQIKVRCACCETEFKTSRVRPSLKKAVRTDTDFCAYFKSVNPDYYVVRVCPYCGYASTENFSDRISLKQKTAYYEKIGNHWKAKDYGGERTEAEAMECYKLALLTAQTVGENIRVIAGILHHIAWLYRYRSDKEQENRFLTFALDAYIQVFEQERDGSNARLMYLIGELNRRLGRYNEAVRWFGRVINDKKIMDASMIRASREMWQTLREDMMRGGLELPEEMKENTV
jgi:hypothetical protein